MRRDDFARLVRQRLRQERGLLPRQAPFMVALTYPSPYFVAMSSLGLQRIYGAIQAEPAMACERFFLPDDARGGPLAELPRSYESLRPLGDFPVVAVSLAYELELAGLVQLLEAAGIPALRRERDGRHPLVVVGGPITFSNPLPAAVYADVIVLGEADTLAVDLLRELAACWEKNGGRPAHEDWLSAAAGLDHVFVPALHGDAMPSLAVCDDALLPACSVVRTPDTELSDMFLIEVERGCSRGCSYCVMRRSTNGGMRLVPPERVLERVPADAAKVGLVGAAVSDHPRVVDIVHALVDRGAQVGLSSLRADRLDDAFVAALKAAGYRTLTTAMDGTSERVRQILDRRTRTHHLVQAAELTRRHQIARLKLYLMVGVPGETDEDVDECAAFVRGLSKIVPLSLAVAPFCPKRNTPLDGQPFAGIATVDRRLARLRRGLEGRAEVRATSSRWAWVEHALAQGGLPEGEAVRRAVLAGGRFAAYKAAFDQLEKRTVRRKLFLVRSAPHDGRRSERWLEPIPE